MARGVTSAFEKPRECRRGDGRHGQHCIDQLSHSHERAGDPKRSPNAQGRTANLSEMRVPETRAIFLLRWARPSRACPLGFRPAVQTPNGDPLANDLARCRGHAASSWIAGSRLQRGWFTNLPRAAGALARAIGTHSVTVEARCPTQCRRAPMCMGDFVLAIGEESAAFGLRTSPSASLSLRLKLSSKHTTPPGPARATPARVIGPIGR